MIDILQKYQRQAPNNEIRLEMASLDSLGRTSAQLQALVRPPLPQVEEFRPRTGYGDPVSRTIGVADAFSADDRFGNPRVDFSGRTSGYAGGTSYPSLNQF